MNLKTDDMRKFISALKAARMAFCNIMSGYKVLVMMPTSMERRVSYVHLELADDECEEVMNEEFEKVNGVWCSKSRKTSGQRLL